jgi:hypothetical protein
VTGKSEGDKAWEQEDSDADVPAIPSQRQHETLCIFDRTEIFQRLCIILYTKPRRGLGRRSGQPTVILNRFLAHAKFSATLSVRIVFHCVDVAVSQRNLFLACKFFGHVSARIVF